MNEMVKSIKEIHNKDVCIYKVGNFYHTYDKDACIVSYLMNYKLKEARDGSRECGFPLDTVKKVVAKLENCKINYLLLDRRNNYEVDERVNFKNLNKYSLAYEKANKYINYKKRINNIAEFLLKNMEDKNFSSILNGIEKVIEDERRKV